MLLLKRASLFCFFLLWAYVGLAQIINSGEVIGGIGRQTVRQCYIDKVGNRYLVATYSSSFDIDSAGTSITIQKNPNTTAPCIAILKYDTAGRYLYHLRFWASEGLENGNYDNLTIAFNSQNEVYLYCRFVYRDSLAMFDRFGQLYRTIVPHVNRNISFTAYYNAAMICKLNTNGQFSWVNSIMRENQGNLIVPASYQFNSVLVNQSDEVTLHFNNVKQAASSSSDTFAITNTLNQKTNMIITTQDILFRFSAAGNLIKVIEPLKNRLVLPHPDSIYYRVYHAVTDGSNTYALIRLFVSQPDTFRCITPLTLDTGSHLLMIKSNSQDSIIWAKSIGVGGNKTIIAVADFQLEYNLLKQELSMGLTFQPSYFQFTHNPSFSNTNSDFELYISKFNSSGTLLTENVYSGGGNERLSSLTYNVLNKRYTVIGMTYSGNFSIGNFALPSPSGGPTIFVVTLDSLHNPYSGQTIKSKFVATGLGQIGYPITDLKGRTYIPGLFFDSIELPCKTLTANAVPDQFGYQQADGFLLHFDAQLPSDTAVCTKMLSPSLKYVWDSSGLYFDTIQNLRGCDSVLLFRLKILQSKSKVDSSVCSRMISLSGKYIWDSSGTYYDTIPNHRNCDSIIRVQLSMLKSSHTIDSTVKAKMISISGKYIWDSTGVYKDTIPNSKGCDSLLTIRLTVLNSQSTLDTLVCRQMISPSGKNIYSLPGTYTDTIQNSIGGDSIMTITVKLLQTQSTVDTTFCGILMSPSGKYLWSLSGTYLDTIPNSNNCDSVITVNFTKSIATDSISINSCGPYLSPSGKYIYDSSGTYRDTIQSVQNCDSVLVIQFNRQLTFSNLDIKACSTFKSPAGNNYTTSGLYHDTLVNVYGCDSIITINLKIYTLGVIVSKSNDISCDSPFATLSAIGGTNYTWEPIAGLSSSKIAQPTASPEKTTMYYVMATDSGGCSSKDSIEVFVNKQEVIEAIPNVFTPNNDGVNDCLYLKTDTELKLFDLIIFNRWGTPVFSTNDSHDCWNGADVTGAQVTEGVYFYILKGVSACDQRIDQRGTVTIIR